MFFGRFPHSSPPRAPIGSHLPPCPARGTGPAAHTGGNGRGGAVLGHAAMLGRARLGTFVAENTRAPGNHQPTSPGPRC